MSELDKSKDFETATNVISTFDRFRAAIREEQQVRYARVEVQNELGGFLKEAEGQRFIISAYCSTRGFKQVSKSKQVSWTYVPTSPLVRGDKQTPFEPREMEIGKVGDGFDEDTNSLALYYPGNYDHKFIVGFSQIVSIEPISETSSIKQ